jgi:hypothetical protein
MSQIVLQPEYLGIVVADRGSTNSAVRDSTPQLVSPGVPIQVIGTSSLDAIDVSSLRLQELRRPEAGLADITLLAGEYDAIRSALMRAEMAHYAAHKNLAAVRRNHVLALLRVAAALALGASVVTGLIASAFQVSDATPFQATAAVAAAVFGAFTAVLMSRRSAASDL